MTAPRTPRNLTPIELLLRHYATQPDTTLPNPLDILDRSTVHHTAAHGPPGACPPRGTTSDT